MLRYLDPKRAKSGIWWNGCIGINKGCTKESAGCLHCWSETESHMRGANPAPWAQRRWGGVTDENGRWNGKVIPLPESLDKVRKPHKPTVWAVWNDLFHEQMTSEYKVDVFNAIKAAPQDTFIILTKRIHYALTFRGPAYRLGLFEEQDEHVDFPNVLLCTSAEDQDSLDRRANALLHCAEHGWKVGLHLSPMLGPIDLAPLFDQKLKYEGERYTVGDDGSRPLPKDKPWISWVVVEGESGPGARPMHPAWVRPVRDQCIAAGVAFWFKQWGEWVPEAQAPGALSNRTAKQALYVDLNGNTRSARFGARCGAATVQRVGKKKAGRRLDGCTWDEYPKREGECSPTV